MQKLEIFLFFSFLFISRSKNGVAHWLALRAHLNFFVTEFIGSPLLAFFFFFVPLRASLVACLC